ncbi:hypothetical protein B0T22DRAFT_35414 [Podospora appendiculata]|uniref:MARVEL domain-containing protein n=1 Tax=Podospora appendiculata TaxID=314037 RepID=A0AAE1CGD3_9PEZI|nr:hypothetical protein B0T22DRAFT_35414 [Podospora appendiculata]
MSATQAVAQTWAAPKAVPGTEEPYIIPSPLWVTVLRGFQIFFSFIILILAGILIHGYAMDANAFAVVCTIMTWIVVTYVLVTEHAAGAHKGYNIWAVLSLDLFLAIFWLASMGANAALRASFTTDVNIEGCYSDHSATSANHCIVSGRDLTKRAAVANKNGLAYMATIAGLSALEWLMFVATLAYNGHTFRMYYQATKGPKADVEAKAQATPMLNQQQPAVVPDVVYPQYTGEQQQYPPQQYPPQQPQPYAPQPYAPQEQAQQYPPQYPVQDKVEGQYPPQQPSPYQTTPYQTPPPQQPPQYPAYQDPSQVQYQDPSQVPYQQAYNPHGTPAQQQPYHPPQQ